MLSMAGGVLVVGRNQHQPSRGIETTHYDGECHERARVEININPVEGLKLDAGGRPLFCHRRRNQHQPSRGIETTLSRMITL